MKEPSQPPDCGAALCADDPYEAFIMAKIVTAPERGFTLTADDISPQLFPHQRDVVLWALRLGRAAIFAAFGLGKSLMQLELAKQVCRLTGGRFLIVCPLGVRQEFMRDAQVIGLPVRFVRRLDECDATGVYLCNYETVRDGKLDPRAFDGASLDEASCLRGFGGTKTFREFMAVFAGDDQRDIDNHVTGESVRYRFVATATPSPNDYIELLAYSAFLGVMDVGGAKTRFFKRDSTKADALTIHPHKEREFWLWVSSWAVFITKPSDLGYSDDGYTLPDIEVRWHELPSDHEAARERERELLTVEDAAPPSSRPKRNPQLSLMRDTAQGLSEAAREKRDSLNDRIAKMMEIRAQEPDEHRIIWHDLESERAAIEKAIPGVSTVYGAQDLDERESIIIGFSDGTVAEVGGKPSMLGSGCNFQRHCARAIYLGIGFKFNDFFQSLHRLQRFQQTRRVVVDLIYTEAERSVREILERKWAQHNELVEQMTGIIRTYGLTRNAMSEEMERAVTVTRVEVKTRETTLVNNDSVNELATMGENSVHHILTSIPFGNMYEYSPSYRDFGHTDGPRHFFEQMDYLTPNLLRVLKPGRVFACHVKDRIVPGGINGLGFQTLYPFHADCISHYTKHGFAFLGMITIVTDVVRENNQTYRLAYGQFKKDGSRMGCGTPEYLLLFRKPQTDRTRGFADEPIDKTDEEYSLSKWQLEAHGFRRSSGNRLLTPKDLEKLPHDKIFKLFRKHNLANVYDYQNHVDLNEALAARGALTTDFMLLQPQSYTSDTWTDIARMRTLNCTQAVKGKAQHLSPMQFDIAERSIDRFTKRGETVLDPFAGIGTVPFCAVKMGRRAVGIELSPRYFVDAVEYVKQAERVATVPTLFDLDAAVSDDTPDVPEELADVAPVKLDAVSPIHVDAPAFGPLFGTDAPPPPAAEAPPAPVAPKRKRAAKTPAADA